jgi:hypothetical protein
MWGATRVWTLGVLLVAGALLSGCSGSSHSGATSSPSGRTIIRVPQDARTIGAAVKQARPGAVVLVSPGTYREMVQVRTPRVTIRGTDRNRVVIDGQVQRPNGVVLVGAGDAVQNLTVRNATLNGVLVTGAVDEHGNGIGRGSDGYSPPNASKFTPLDGFLVDHVTSYDNGLYGIYAFDAINGEIRDSYTSGMADSGIYVGQCKPCGIAVHGNVAERNAVGYEGTNASGAMYVYGNRFVGNRVGATTNSEHQEALLPQTDALIAGNVIAANDQAKTPEQADGGFGIGFGIAGGTHNVVRNNRIEANPVVGVQITNSDDLPPVGNEIRANLLRGNGVDLVYSAAAAAAGNGNCLAGPAATVRPARFPRRCPAAGAVPAAASPAMHAPPGIPFTDVQPPPPLAQLPGAAAAGAPSVGRPAAPPESALTVPSAGLLADQSSIRW